MARYVKCIIVNEWKPIHDDPLVREACQRILDSVEPTPEEGKVYKVIAHYYSDLMRSDDEECYKGYLLEEFDWSEYLIKDSLGHVARANVYWNQAKFEVVETKFEPDHYHPDFGHCETMKIVATIKYDRKKDDDDEPEGTRTFIHEG